jgi:hypothetical protein
MAAGVQGRWHQSQLTGKRNASFSRNTTDSLETAMGQIFLVVPDAPIEQATQLDANRTLGESGIRLGILDNTKGNADHLLNMIIEGVKKEFKVDSVVMTRKAASSRPAAEDILDKLAKEADLVVSAMAD